MLSFGSLRLESPLILSPMAGISDLPYRIINRSFGCRFAFTEMISANSLVHTGRQTAKMLASSDEDRPLGVQLVGSSPEVIERALHVLSAYPFDLLDFNAACPVRKVVTQGQGAGLLREPRRLQEILRLIVRKSPFPVTVKIRAGWDEDSVNAVEIARMAEDAGVSGLFIHGRTRVQGYAGRVDYTVIRKVKEALSVPVIASGDALSAELILKLMDETGCDGVAVARGALGNPWIFPETISYLRDRTLIPRPAVAEVLSVMKEHLSLLAAFHGERTGVVQFRKFFIWYTRGLPVKRLKERAFRAASCEDMLALIDEIEIRTSLSPVEQLS